MGSLHEREEVAAQAGKLKSLKSVTKYSLQQIDRASGVEVPRVLQSRGWHSSCFHSARHLPLPCPRKVSLVHHFITSMKQQLEIL